MICKIATAVIGLEMLAICRSDAANLRDLFPSNPDVGDIPRRSRPIDDPSSSNHKIKRRLGSLSVRDKATKENANHSETASDSQSEVFHETVISIREGLTWLWEFESANTGDYRLRPLMRKPSRLWR